MNYQESAQWVEDFEGKDVPPTLIKSGQGGWIRFEDGRRAFEAVSGHSCLNLGHAHPELLETAGHALSTLSYCSPEHYSDSSLALAERLSELLGGAYRIKYALSGSSANEIAMTIARRYWEGTGKPAKRIAISLDRSYHGNMGQAQFATGYEAFRVSGYSDHSDYVHVPCARNPASGKLFSTEEIRALLEARIAQIGQDNIACMIVEPINFAGGVIVPPDGYLAIIHELCRRHDITLIVDEVITGFGRSGKWFAFQKEGIRPDIVTMGKGITAGYFPLAAVAVTNSLYMALRESKVPLKKVITMAGHPVGCEVALKNIEITARDGLCKRAEENAGIFCEVLKPLERLRSIKEVRGVGHMWALEFADFDQQKAPEIAKMVAARCEDENCIVAASAGIIRINPPLNSSIAEISFACSTLVNAVEYVDDCC